MQELSATLKAMYEAENRKNKFLAAMNGVELDADSESSDDQPATTLQDIQSRVHARLTGDKSHAKAIEYGFTAEMGLSYEMVGDLDG